MHICVWPGRDTYFSIQKLVTNMSKFMRIKLWISSWLLNLCSCHQFFNQNDLKNNIPFFQERNKKVNNFNLKNMKEFLSSGQKNKKKKLV